MMRENGFINVTKLCKEGGKEFFTWKQNKSSELFLEAVFPDLGIPRSGLLIVINSGNTDTLIRGTYAHPDLVPHIASWVSPSFAVKVSRIVNEYLVREEKDRCARLEAKNIDLVKMFEESERKAEEHRLKFDEQCIKAEEERRKSEERYQNMCKRYGFQEEILGEVKHELVETKDKLEYVQESLELNTERLGHVEDKLGIAKEIVVPKEQNKDYHEMFTLPPEGPAPQF